LLGGLIGSAFAFSKLGFGGDEFATEGFGKDGLRNTIYLLLGSFVTGLDLIGTFK
jgi:hypothetical protein